MVNLFFNPNISVSAVIFDLDGVICHTDNLHYSAWNYVCKELSIPFSEDINRYLRGVSRMDCVDIILSRTGISMSTEEKKRFADEKNNLYSDLLSGLNPADVHDDVIKTLSELKAHKIKMAIASSSCNARQILLKLDLISRFDAVIDGTQISRSKPDPEVFLKAAEALQLPPEKCIVVEDAEAGIQAAKSGGFITVGIGDSVKLCLADYHINVLCDLIS